MSNPGMSEPACFFETDCALSHPYTKYRFMIRDSPAGLSFGLSFLHYASLYEMNKQHSKWNVELYLFDCLLTVEPHRMLLLLFVVSFSVIC